MSVNVFESILVIKSHSVIELFFAVSLKLWGHPEEIFCVHGTRKCRMLDMFIVHYIGEHWTVYRQPLQLVLRQFCGAVPKGQNGCHCEWELVVVFTARCHASAVLAMGLCLSVCLCLSVTSRSFTKTAKRRITQRTQHDSPGTLSFPMPKISAKFDRGHPLRGRRMQVGWSKSATFDK